jgi:hypothetical protein
MTSPETPTVFIVDDDARMRAAMQRLSKAVGLHSALLLLLTTLVLALTGCHRSTKPDVEAKISFTQVPQWSPGDENEQDIFEGRVRGARQGQHIVVYSKTGRLWWLQPLLTSPSTPILPDGVWRNEAHLGTDYAALLVDSSYYPVPVLGELPNRGSGVEAVAASRGQEKSSSFFVNFSGYTWRVRWVSSDRGGTRNPYDPDNVYVDKDGALHLQIIKRKESCSPGTFRLIKTITVNSISILVVGVIRKTRMPSLPSNPPSCRLTCLGSQPLRVS